MRYTLQLAVLIFFILGINKVESSSFRDSKLKKINDLLIQGQNEEAIFSANTYIKKRSKEPISENYAYAYILKANGLWADYQFSKANQSIEFLKEKLSKSSDEKINREINFFLSQYYFETNQIAIAEVYIEKAINGNTFPSIHRLELDIILQKAKILVKQGYAVEPLKLLNMVEEYGKRLADGMGEVEEDKYFANKNWNSQAYKENYAEITFVRMQAVLLQGDLTEAEKISVFLKEWIAKNLGKSHPLYQKVCFEEALIFKEKEQPFKALDNYLKAYLTNERPESDPLKLSALVECLKSYCELGLTVESQNYLRRIQLYAFRNAGMQEPNEFAYQWSFAYLQYWENNLPASKAKIAILEKYFSFAPACHPAKESIRELKAKIAFQEGDFVGYHRSLDTIAYYASENIGKNTPAHHLRLMEVAQFETFYERKLIDAKNDINKAYYQGLKKQISPLSIQYSKLQGVLADYYSKNDLYDSAAVCQQKAMEGIVRILGQGSLKFVEALTKLAYYQLYSGEYSKAQSNLKLINAIFPQIKSDDYEQLANICIQIANLEASLGEIAQSREHLSKAFGYSEKKVRHSFINDLENSYQKTISTYAKGNYFQAEKELLGELNKAEGILTKRHSFLNRFYLAHAELLVENSNYSSAENAINNAVASTEPGSVEIAQVYLVQSEYQLAIFDYKSALASIIAADEILVAKLGKAHLKRSEALIKLADASAKAKKLSYAEIEKLYTLSTEIIKNSVGVNHPLYAFNLERQAEFYIENNKLAEAEKLLLEAQKYWSNLVGEKNSNVAEILAQLGKIYYLRENYSEAEKYYSKAKTYFNDLYNTNHSSYIKAQSSLARVYFMRNNPKAAFDAISEIVPIYLDYTKKYFPSLSFRQKSKFWNSFKEDFDFYNFLALEKFDKTSPVLRGDVYNLVISTKALLLSSDIKLRKTIASSNDSTLISQFNDWLGKKEVLTQTLALSREEQLDQGIDARALELDIEKLEKSLSTRSTLFASKEKKQITQWTDIRGILTDKEVAVEIIRYPIFNKKTTDTIKYVALVIQKGSSVAPELVRIGDGKELEGKWLKYYRNAMKYKSSDEFSYSKFWKALKSEIPDGQTIYLSSEGVYNQLNVETITDPSGVYILDKNPVVLITNTRDLVPESTKELPFNSNPSVLSGAPEFYTTATTDHKSIVDLPGAEVEVSTIQSLFESASAPAQVLYKKEVLEDTIKALKSPRIFHIATHGYFKETTETNDEDPASNPLLNSGLMLAGSGDIIDNKENAYVNQKPGVLTAQEALDLNFENTDLVVLSACETGRGSIQVGEGVYGLQRAFLTAGSKAIILSLFKVNDEVTQKLMKIFYQKVLSGQTVRQSFADAKKQIKAEYPEPIYWGAFVLIESSPKAKASLRSGAGVARK